MQTASSPNLYNQLSSLYADQSPLRRLFLWARWQICPFDDIMRLVPPAKRAIELGCGIGVFSNLIHLLGISPVVDGFDNDQNAIAVAQSTYRNRVGIRFVEKDVRDLKTDDRYDLVVMNDVLHHIPYENQSNVLQLASRLLTDNGTLFIKEVDDRPVWAAWANYLHDTIQGHRPFMIKNNDLVQILVSNGFEIRREWRRRTHYIPHIAYVAVKKDRSMGTAL